MIIARYRDDGPANLGVSTDWNLRCSDTLYVFADEETYYKFSRKIEDIQIRKNPRIDKTWDSEVADIQVDPSMTEWSQADREWYAKALQVLGPLRHHLATLVAEMESYNRFAVRAGTPELQLPEDKIDAAKAANAAADSFFTNNRNGENKDADRT
jgi:hypothetical protein